MIASAVPALDLKSTSNPIFCFISNEEEEDGEEGTPEFDAACVDTEGDVGIAPVVVAVAVVVAVVVVVVDVAVVTVVDVVADVVAVAADGVVAVAADGVVTVVADGVAAVDDGVAEEEEEEDIESGAACTTG